MTTKRAHTEPRCSTRHTKATMLNEAPTHTVRRIPWRTSHEGAWSARLFEVRSLWLPPDHLPLSTMDIEVQTLDTGSLVHVPLLLGNTLVWELGLIFWMFWMIFGSPSATTFWQRVHRFTPAPALCYLRADFVVASARGGRQGRSVRV